MLLDFLIVNGGDQIGDTLIVDLLEKCTYNNHRVFVAVQREDLHKDFYEKCNKYLGGRLRMIFKSANHPIPVPYNDLIDYSFQVMPFSQYVVFMDDDIVIKDYGFIEKIINFIDNDDYSSGIYASNHSFDIITGKLKNCFIVVSKKVLKEVGYFDENLVGKDAINDFEIRARIAGYTPKFFGTVSETYFDHIGGVGTALNPEYEAKKQASAAKAITKVYHREDKSFNYIGHRSHELDIVNEIHLAGISDKDKERVLDHYAQLKKPIKPLKRAL